MNAIATTAEGGGVSHATLEHVLATGDLSKLSVQQRVEYYSRVCQTLGLNPLTRPFRFLSLNGQTQLYATKDCTDQLRSLHKISLTIVDKAIDGDIYTVTARATQPDGRTDEDVGAVTLGRLTGDSKANAVMKAMTKAKRRVTLSIRGLGFLDESELDTLPSARVFDPEDPVPGEASHADAAVQPDPEAEALEKARRFTSQAIEQYRRATTQVGLDAIEHNYSRYYARLRIAYPDLAGQYDEAKLRAEERIRIARQAVGGDMGEQIAEAGADLLSAG